MDPKSNIKLCVICCSGFNSASTVQSDAILCREHLVNFCKLLATSPPKQTEQFDNLLEKSFPGMDKFFEDSGMSVCVDCHHTITVAMEKGTEAGKKEEEVRKLQLQILEQMKQLQKQLDVFHEEMSKVEKVIQNSDVSCLMYHMAKNPSKNEDATNGIVLIRDRIIDVMTDLRDFQSRQNNILNIDLEKIYAQIAQRLNPSVNLDGDDDDFIPYIPFEPEVIIGTEGLEEAGLENPMFFGHTIFGNIGDYRFEATNHESDFSEGEVADVGSDDSSVVSDYSPSDYVKKQVEQIVPIQKITQPIQKKSQAIQKIPQPIQKMPTYQPTPRQVALITPTPTPSTSSSFPSAPIRKERMSTFKREIIERALQRESNRKPEDAKNLDPLKRYQVKYNPSTDRLTLHDFEILVEEGIRSLRCATCGFLRREDRKGGSLDCEWKMRVHVVSVHIGFHCPDPNCKQKQSTDYPQYLKHLKMYHEKQRFAPNIIRGTGKRTPANSNNSIGNRPARETRSSANHLPPHNSPRLRQQEQVKPVAASSGTVLPRKICPVCREVFIKKDEFIRHLQSHRKPNRRPMPKPRSDPEEEPEIVVLD